MPSKMGELRVLSFALGTPDTYISFQFRNGRTTILLTTPKSMGPVYYDTAVATYWVGPVAVTEE